MNKITFTYLIVFIALFLHSETGIISAEGDNHAFHDICQILEQSNIPTTNAQISVIQIIDTFLISNITHVDTSIINYIHRNDYIYNPLSQFFEDDLIHLFHILLI